MPCPRCGHQAEGMARACPACGYILPFSLRQLRQQRDAQGLGPGLGVGVGSGPIAPDAGHGAQMPVMPGMPNLPEMPGLAGLAGAPPMGDRADRREQAGWPASLPPTRASSSGRLTGPLRLEPSDDAPREHTSILPAVSATTGRHAAPGEQMALVPVPMGYPEPPPDDASQALGTTTSMLAALGAGALLKSGRYRLARRFSAAVSFGRHGEPEPPLYVASDLERPATRVLVQELPLVDARPDLADLAQHQAAARLRAAANQGIVPHVLDAFTERGRRFLVLELPEGEQLAEILRRKVPAAEPDVIQLGLRLLDAEAAQWTMTPHLVHGNLCPDYVLLRPDGSVMLVGFSPTVLVQGTIPLDHGCAGGVRGYAAPEQQRGQADVRADLYAIAAMLHQAATGQRPPARTSGALGSARAINPTISTGLDDLLNRALRPAPAQRIGTVEEFRAGLLALLPPGYSAAPSAGRLAVGAGGRALQPALPGPLAALRAGLQQSAAPPLVRSRSLRIVLAALLLVALLATGTMYLVRAHGHGPSVAAQPTADATATALYRQAHIGVSDGRLLFDTTRPDASLKQRAAAALARGDTRSAYALFKQAAESDPGDVEAAIYAEDARIALAGGPTVTIAVAASFGDPAGASDSVLRGAYLAQQRTNSLDLLPGTTQLRVLIANAGTDSSGAADAAHLIARAAATPSAHLIGVVGWPDADRTRAALATLGTLPYVVPGAAVDGVSGPGYFALGPSDAQQGATLASAITPGLGDHRVFVLTDPGDARGAALAGAFVAAAQQLAGQPVYISHQEALTGTTPAAYTLAMQHALYSYGADTILVAGGTADVVGLAQAIQQQAPWAVAHVHILAPTWAYTPALLGVGTDATAQAVRADPAMLRDVVAASLAASDEWTAAGVGLGRQPSLFAAYRGRFGTVQSPTALPQPDATVILAYDAVQLLGTAATTAATGTKLPDADALRGAIAALRPGAGWQGVGGAIAFSGSGAPIGKALALLGLVPSPSGANGPALVPTTLAIAGGTSAFCVAAGCSAG